MTDGMLDGAREALSERLVGQVLEDCDGAARSGGLPWYMREESTALAFEWLADSVEAAVSGRKGSSGGGSLAYLNSSQLRHVAMKVREAARG